MILRAARELFGVHGYSATTVRMVAHRAGVSIQAVYYHFRGIRHIYDEVAADIVDRMAIAARDVFTQPTLRAQIRTYAYAMHTLDYSDRSVMDFTIREHLDAQRDRRRSGTPGALAVGTEQFFTALVRGAVERGELDPDADVRATVGVLASIMWGVGLYAGFVPDPDTMEPVTNLVDEFIANGLPLVTEPAPAAAG